MDYTYLQITGKKARRDQRRLEYRRKLGVVQDGQDNPAADVLGGETLAPPATEFPAPTVTNADMNKIMVSLRKVYWYMINI